MPTQAFPYMALVCDDLSLTITHQQDPASGIPDWPLQRGGWAPKIPPLRAGQLGGRGPYEDVVESYTIDVRGDTDGLREASLGRRVFGFDAFSTQNIKVPPQTTGNSQSEVGVAFHRTAFCLVTRPLVLPQGAANAVVANYKGFSLRVVLDYDIDLKQDVCSIDTLYGTKTLDANRAVLVKDVDVA